MDLKFAGLLIISWLSFANTQQHPCKKKSVNSIFGIFKLTVLQHKFAIKNFTILSKLHKIFLKGVKK